MWTIPTFEKYHFDKQKQRMVDAEAFECTVIALNGDK